MFGFLGTNTTRRSSSQTSRDSVQPDAALLASLGIDMNFTADDTIHEADLEDPELLAG
jgi:hypothetical protein